MCARIVFDLDGTLIDSAPDIHGIANTVLSAEGADPISLDQARDFIGNGISVFVEKMRQARDIPDSAHHRLLAGFDAAYDEAVHLTVPYPGVEAALRALLAEGHGLAVCTNKPERPARAVLDHLGLADFFSVILGGDSLPTRKPDPGPLNAAFAGLPEGPEIYVGDSDVDAETAQRAGVPFLLFTEGYRKHPVDQMPHTAAFFEFSGLPELIERVLSKAA